MKKILFLIIIILILIGGFIYKEEVVNFGKEIYYTVLQTFDKKIYESDIIFKDRDPLKNAYISNFYLKQRIKKTDNSHTVELIKLEDIQEIRFTKQDESYDTCRIVLKHLDVCGENIISKGELLTKELKLKNRNTDSTESFPISEISSVRFRDYPDKIYMEKSNDPEDDVEKKCKIVTSQIRFKTLTGYEFNIFIDDVKTLTRDKRSWILTTRYQFDDENEVYYGDILNDELKYKRAGSDETTTIMVSSISDQGIILGNQNTSIDPENKVEVFLSKGSHFYAELPDNFAMQLEDLKTYSEFPIKINQNNIHSMEFIGTNQVNIVSKYANINSWVKEGNFISLEPLRGQKAEFEPSQIEEIKTLSPKPTGEASMTLKILGDELRCDYDVETLIFKPKSIDQTLTFPVQQIKKYDTTGENPYITTVNILLNEEEKIFGEILDEYLPIILDGFKNNIQSSKITSIDFPKNSSNECNEKIKVKILLTDNSLIFANILFDVFTIQNDGVSDEEYSVKKDAIQKVEFPANEGKEATLIYKYYNDDEESKVIGTIKEDFFSVKPIGYSTSGITLKAENIKSMEFF